MTNNKFTPHDQQLLDNFFSQENLTEPQAKSFTIYLAELITWNRKFNLTALTTVEEIIFYHFQDSLKIREFLDFSTVEGLVDIGTGAGFPAIPLKIVFSALPIILLEVNQKKVSFLEHIIALLKLEHVTVCSFDWRTFLRQTNYKANLFCARASLDPVDLVHLFKPSCPYNQARLIYWSSVQWEKNPKIAPFLQKEVFYAIGSKKRKFVFFQKK